MKGLKFKFDYPDYLIVTWHSNDTPLAESGRQVYDNTSSGTEITLVPTNVGGGAYIFKFWQSTNNSDLQTLLTQWAIDGSLLNGSEDFTVYEYKVGRGQSGTGPDWADPAPGDKELHDARLAGQKFYFFRIGQSFVQKSYYSELSAGGIRLADPDDNTFQIDDEWNAMVVSQVAAVPAPTGGYTEVVTVASNSTFTVADFAGRLNLAGFAGTGTATSTFPAFNTIPGTIKAKFIAHGGNQLFWTLQFQAGDTIFYAGEARNYIQLGKGEWIEIIWINNVAYVLDDKTSYEIIGETIAVDNKEMLNTWACDGSGEEHNISSFRRLIDSLDPERIVTYADYDKKVTKLFVDYYPNRGKFAVNWNTGKFKFPDLRDRIFQVLSNFYGDDPDAMSQGANGLKSYPIEGGFDLQLKTLGKYGRVRI